jgi:hypothetical protein
MSFGPVSLWFIFLNEIINRGDTEKIETPRSQVTMIFGQLSNHSDPETTKFAQEKL